MQVKFDPDLDVRAGDLAHAGYDVRLAVVVAIGHHRPVQKQEHGVDRQRRLKVGQYLITQALVGRAGGQSGGLRKGEETKDQLPAAGLDRSLQTLEDAAKPGDIRATSQVGGADDGEIRGSRRDGRKGVGFRGDSAGEYFHNELLIPHAHSSQRAPGAPLADGERVVYGCTPSRSDQRWRAGKEDWDTWHRL